jgi:hypothetical protein
MNKSIKVSVKLLLQLIKTSKVFLIYNEQDNSVTDYIITNDLIRYRKSYDKFVLIETIKPQITNLTIKLENSSEAGGPT